jgi:hypothetical protein
MLQIRGNMGQCKSEHQDFKKAKERTWDSVTLRTETLEKRKKEFRSEALKSRKKTFEASFKE